MKFCTERIIYYNFKRVCNPVIINIFKEYEKEIIKQYKTEIDKLLKILYALTTQENIDIVKYSFFHKIENDTLCTYFCIKILCKDGLYISKPISIIKRNLDEIDKNGRLKELLNLCVSKKSKYM